MAKWITREIDTMIALAEEGMMPHGSIFPRLGKGKVTDEDRARAALTVLAVNSFQPMRDALQLAKTQLSWLSVYYRGYAADSGEPENIKDAEAVEDAFSAVRAVLDGEQTPHEQKRADALRIVLGLARSAMADEDEEPEAYTEHLAAIKALEA